MQRLHEIIGGKNVRSFVIPFGRPALMHCIEEAIATGKKHRVTVEVFKTKRSLDANAYYWGQVITPMAQHTGYTPEEMHEALLAEIYGTRLVSPIPGKCFHIAQKRTHNMTTTEFQDHIHHCQRIAAELGVAIQPEAA
jgi:hypothetical protein